MRLIEASQSGIRGSLKKLDLRYRYSRTKSDIYGANVETMKNREDDELLIDTHCNE